ncbi:MAG: hypothetical protein ACXVA6_16120, partial [Isosphaeraceae bacterium]
MPYSFPPDVNELVCAHMSSGKYASEDELLRAALQALRLQAELPGRPTATRPLPTSIVPASPVTTDGLDISSCSG